MDADEWMSTRNLYKHEDGPQSYQVRVAIKGFVRCCTDTSELLLHVTLSLGEVIPLFRKTAMIWILILQ